MFEGTGWESPPGHVVHPNEAADLVQRYASWRPTVGREAEKSPRLHVCHKTRLVRSFRSGQLIKR